MTNPLVTINIVVFNGEKYIRHCLKAVAKQSYPNIEVNIFDNNSNDRTREIAVSEFPALNLIPHPQNLGMWPGHEKALEHSHGEYTVALSVDVILDKNFVQEAVEAFERHPKAGALQAKVYQYDLKDIDQGIQPVPVVVDTCGFQLSRSRRVKNIGHGETDNGQFGQEKEIFGIEGAVPIFRKNAFESCRVQGHIADPDFFWYGDDLDLAWRLRLFGWEEWYVPALVAYHDRSTTNCHSK
ncbi:MAG: glycosyltransferase, partial [Candidatus Yanofskybacteria bacterium]|nr:glycosyltransferase [Candidatus Yanofskybacteria bacterium]